MPLKTYKSSLTILHDNFDFFFLDPKVVQEQTCEKLKSDFDLSDDEAKNYYEMIKDEENNKIIEEVEKKVRVKVAQTGSFNIEFSGQKKVISI